MKPQADLILRFEEIARWGERLCGAGIDVTGRSMAHHHKSARGESEMLETLKMTGAEYLRLETEVRAYFRADAETFGYPSVPVRRDPPT